jgi:hypothetical protein
MIRQLKQARVLHGLWPGEIHLAFAGHGHGPSLVPAAPRVPVASAKLPPRPDTSVINAAIPLFYIGRNRNGLWVAREAEGRLGGMFVSKRSALRFARESSEPHGCATMIVATPLELDFAKLRDTPSTACRVSLLAGVVAAVAAVGRFFARMGRTHANERARQAVEKELFHGRYTLTSKNDDDLPPVL